MTAIEWIRLAQERIGIINQNILSDYYRDITLNEAMKFLNDAIIEIEEDEKNNQCPECTKLICQECVLKLAISILNGQGEIQ